MKKLTNLLKSVADFVRPDPPPREPMSVAAARALTERNQFMSLFTWQDFDDELKLMALDSGDGLAVGFILVMNPLSMAGTDAEPQLESVIAALPAESVVQFGKLVTPQVEGYINAWAEARLQNNHNPLLRQIAERRRDFLLTTAAGPSMLPQSRMHPRMTQLYLSVRIPFDESEPPELFFRRVVEIRANVQATLTSVGMGNEVLDRNGCKFLLRELLNPHVEPSERVSDIDPDALVADDVLTRNTRVTVQPGGGLTFSAGDTGEEVAVTVMTVDRPPASMTLPMMAQTLGNPLAWDERITCPYWAYTTIHILHSENAKDALTNKLGLLDRQSNSESNWLRTVMGSTMRKRNQSVHALIESTTSGHQLVRAYSGINLYTPPSEARQQTENVRSLYLRAGFRISPEAFISLPVFVASMPLQYNQAMDPVNGGLHRARMMSSLNAVSMVHVQGDWRGNSPAKGGLLLTSRSGQIATFDLLETQTNYNFVVVAQSGSGKSFLTNEIIADFLSKGGIARVVDVGSSYERFCQEMGGEVIRFAPDRPMSLNAFSGIKTQDDLNELMPMLKDLLRLMAYPLTPEEQTPAFQYSVIEQAISAAWAQFGPRCDLSNVVEWLRGMDDARYQDLAVQLEPFSHGRYARWFRGERTVSFKKPFVVIELEELKQDPALQSVVLQLMMFQVSQEMYLSDRRLPKLLAIDEAWDLMGGMKTGRFIETAFRRMRKYNGIAGVITQSFEDFEKSDAAKAAIANAAWQFILAQKPESVDFAIKNERISADPSMAALIKSVRSGPGFSEVYVRSESGGGLYRFVTDRHSYYTYTTKAADINRLRDLTDQGYTLEAAIDELSRADYAKLWA